uniref:Uncharacterized protein n=1 Tax=Oryza nivara TaxID=4536 RepID=A0A0E0GK67_ORYNI
MESGDAMESGARDVLFLCARMNAHFSVGSGSPSCRLDSEPVVTVDSAYVEAAAMDHAIITVDAGVGTMPIHKKFTDNNIHIHRAAHKTDNNTDNLLGQQQQIPVNIFNLQQQLPNARK